MKILFVILSMISYSFSARLNVTDLKIISDTIPKYQVKYFDEYAPPSNTIFEKSINEFNFYMWDTSSKKAVFHTSTDNLFNDPYFTHNRNDTDIIDKPIFYISNNVFGVGNKIIYCQSAVKNYFKKPSDSAYVMVKIFDPNDSSKFDFTFREKVFKNTTFVIWGERSGGRTFVFVDMYQGGYVKTIVKYDTFVKPVNIIASKKNKVYHFRNIGFDLTGRIK